MGEQWAWNNTDGDDGGGMCAVVIYILTDRNMKVLYLHG